MNKSTLTFWMLCIPFLGMAQPSTRHYAPAHIKFGKDSFDIIFDTDTAFFGGTVKIPDLNWTVQPILKLDNLLILKDGYVRKMFHNKWGLTTLMGTDVIPVKYDGIGTFERGRAKVHQNGLSGFVNTEGQEICPPRYAEIRMVDSSIAKVRMGQKWGLIAVGNKNIKELTLLKYDFIGKFQNGMFEIMLNGKWGFVSRYGTELISPIYEAVGAFWEGVAGVKKNNLWGFVNAKGVEVIPLKYKEVNHFSNGVAAVLKTDDKRVFINIKNEALTKLWFSDVLPLSEGYAPVRIGQKWGFIGVKQELVKCQYDAILPFQGGVARVMLKHRWGLIDRSGKLIVPIKYHWIDTLSEGVMRIGLKGKWGCLRKDGAEIAAPQYDMVSLFTNGVVYVRSKGKMGAMDGSGKWLVPLKYDVIMPFKEGLAAVELNDFHGFVNKKGVEVVALKYDEADSFSEGLARVRFKYRFGFIDATGAEVIPLRFSDAGDCASGAIPVCINGQWGIVRKPAK
jgi:hypothetical protein